MGFFLVLFPEEQHYTCSTPSSSSSAPFKTPAINSILKRTNSSHIFSRAQSTISVCAVLIFLTFLVFTLSSFEPNNDFISSHHNLHQYRRFLAQNPPNFDPESRPNNSPALQGLGSLYTRGTTAMNTLVICHVSELVTAKELRLFLRTFHRSGLPSKSDILFIFNSISTTDSFDDVIREENDVFLKLLHRYKAELGNGTNAIDFPASFDPTRFVKSVKKVDEREPIWGRRTKTSNSSMNDGDDDTESTQLSYGSVVGFGIGELDPENSLSGFLDHVPMNMRRWASYPMVLGRVRRKFKHVMLVDVKELLLLGDPLARVRGHTPESVILTSTTPPKHNRKPNKSHRKVVNPSLIIGGERGVRRLSAAVMTEIVRATTHHHHKQNSVTESALLSQLAGNEFLQKSIRFMSSTESVHDPSSHGGVELANMTVVRRGNSNFDIGEAALRRICSFPVDSSVYIDC